MTAKRQRYSGYVRDRDATYLQLLTWASVAYRIASRSAQREALAASWVEGESNLSIEQSDRFRWTTFDVDDLLPNNWTTTLLSIINLYAMPRTLIATSVTSREATPGMKIPTLTVGGRTLRECAPWLYKLYHGTFRTLGESVAGKTLVCAKDDRYGAVINVQRGEAMRYECHVDSNPLEGLLYVTTHRPGDGGELVVARDRNAHSVNEIDANCDTIYPVAGCLVFFDARDRPHYVRAISEGSVRAVVAMNFYTQDCPESRRPADLNHHLFGES